MRFTRTTRLPTPALDTPWREAEFCVFDFETTGLNLRRDEIVSYGAPACWRCPYTPPSQRRTARTSPPS